MNDTAFEELFKKYYIPLCQYALRYVNRSAVAEDIVQDFFIRVYEKKISAECFRAYAFQSVWNACMNYYKRELVHEEALDDFINEQAVEATNEDERELKKKILLAVKKVPFKSRKILYLKFINGLKYKEIAEITSISVNTVKYHICEALKLLRNELR